MRLNTVIKIKQRVAILFGMVPFVCFGQTYTISPNDSMVVTAPFNTYSHFIIEQHNTTGSYIRLGWEQLSVNIPSGWVADLCDLGNCFTGFPAGGIMDTVFAGDYGLLSVAVDPLNITGTGLVQYSVWDINTPNQRDTLTWIINAGVAGIAEPDAGTVFQVQSANSGNALLVTTDHADNYTYLVSDIAGKQIAAGHFNMQQTEIPLTAMSSGVYVVCITGSTKISQTRKIYLQQR